MTAKYDFPLQDDGRKDLDEEINGQMSKQNAERELKMNTKHFKIPAKTFEKLLLIKQIHKSNKRKKMTIYERSCYIAVESFY